MSFQLKGVIDCEQCPATAEVMVSVSERTSDSGCGCCSRGTGEYYVDLPTWGSIPDGWRSLERSGRYLCPEHRGA